MVFILKFPKLCLSKSVKEQHSNRIIRSYLSTSLSKANLAVYLGAFCNAGLAGSKGFIGYSIGSTALIADAVNSLGDILGDAVVYYSLNAARKGPSKHNPWGSGKLEPLGALSVGVLLLATGGGVCYSAITAATEIIMSSGVGVGGGAEAVTAASAVIGSTSTIAPSLDILIVDPHKAKELFQQGSLLSYSAIGISGVSIVIKEALYRITLKAGKLAQSDSVIANAYQHRADVLLSAAVLVGLSGSMLGFPLLDPLAGVLVSGVILNQGIRTTIDASRDLIDSPASKDETKQLINTCLSVNGVKSVVNLQARKSGPFLFVEVTLGVKGSISASEAHRIAELTKLELLDRYKGRVANAIIHIDPLGASGMGHQAPVQSRDYIDVASSIEKLLAPITEIISISEVQLYYKDDGNIKIKVDVCMNPNMTIRQAHDIAQKAEQVIAGSLTWAQVDVDLELDERGGAAATATITCPTTSTTSSPTTSTSTTSTATTTINSDGIPVIVPGHSSKI